MKGLPSCSLLADTSLYGAGNMKTIVAFIVGLLIATAWAQVDRPRGSVMWLPASIGTLNGKGYQMGLRNDSVVVWRWSRTTENDEADGTIPK
jgi:hypothetical protein